MWFVKGAGTFNSTLGAKFIPNGPWSFGIISTEPGVLYGNAALNAPDTSVLSFSFWAKINGVPDGLRIDISNYFLDNDAGSHTSEVDLRLGVGLNPISGVPQFAFTADYGAEPDFEWSALIFIGEGFSFGTWCHFIGVANTATRQWTLYINDNQTGSENPDFYDGYNVPPEFLFAPFTLPFNSITTAAAIGVEFSLGGGEAELAECWIAFNQDISENGIIPLETRRKFITEDGTPSDLGSHGEIPD